MVGMWILVPAGVVAGILDWPPELPRGSHTNFVLAVGLSGLSLWWGLAVRSTKGLAVRTSSWIGFIGASIGALTAVILALGVLMGVGPPFAALWVISLVALEVPAWALALVLWPSHGEQPPESRRLSILDVGILATSVMLLFWDFLYRPAGRMPTVIFEQTAWASWMLVLLFVHVAAFRGSTPEFARAFKLMLASLGATFAGSYLITTLPTWPPRIAVVAGAVALLLRLTAAEVLRSGIGTSSTRGKSVACRDWAVHWLGMGALSLLGLHQVLAPPGGLTPLLPGVIALGSLLLLRLVMRGLSPN